MIKKEKIYWFEDYQKTCKHCGTIKTVQKKHYTLVYPCKACGRLPEWGSGFLGCFFTGCSENYETCGKNAVREWNRKMGPQKKNK